MHTKNAQIQTEEVSKNSEKQDKKNKRRPKRFYIDVNEQGGAKFDAVLHSLYEFF